MRKNRRPRRRHVTIAGRRYDTRYLPAIAGGQYSDWLEELILGLTLWQQVKQLKAQGASGEVDLAITATVKATGQTIPLSQSIPVKL